MSAEEKDRARLNESGPYRLVLDKGFDHVFARVDPKRVEEEMAQRAAESFKSAVPAVCMNCPFAKQDICTETSSMTMRQSMIFSIRCEKRHGSCPDGNASTNATIKEIERKRDEDRMKLSAMWPSEYDSGMGKEDFEKLHMLTPSFPRPTHLGAVGSPPVFTADKLEISDPLGGLVSIDSKTGAMTIRDAGGHVRVKTGIWFDDGEDLTSKPSKVEVSESEKRKALLERMKDEYARKEAEVRRAEEEAAELKEKMKMEEAWFDAKFKKEGEDSAKRDIPETPTDDLGTW